MLRPRCPDRVRCFCILHGAASDSNDHDWRCNRALAATCVHLMLRPSKALVLYRNDLMWDRDGVHCGHIAQNYQFGEECLKEWTQIKLALGCAGYMSGWSCVAAWLELRGSVPGCCEAHAHAWCMGRHDHVNQLAKRIAVNFGLQGLYTGYSFRIAGATWGATGGMSIAEIQAIGGWKSEAVLRCLRGAAAVVSGASARIGI